ncbi:MAG: oligosaccharide flippase family protein [Thauera sp.]|nr:oligosaccharide flippase family protein [Thauera sp.]
MRLRAIEESKLLAKIRRRVGEGGGVASNILVLLLGSVTARAVSLLAIPVLTRLYSPDHFGVLALYTATVALIAPFATLRYHVAIPLPRHDAAAVCLLALVMLTASTITTLVALVILIFGHDLFRVLSIESLAPYRWLVVLGVASTSIYEVFQYWSLRKKRMARIASTQVMQSLSSVGVKLGMGALGYTPIGLILGQLMQQGGGVVSLARQFALDVARKPRRVDLRRLVLVASRYRGFPALRLPSQFLLVAATQLPLLLAAAMFGTATAGQFSLAFSALAIPVTLVSQTVGSAYYAEIASLGPHRRAEIRALTFGIMKKLALIGVAPVAFLALLGPWFFSVAFGEVWRDAGRFAQILAFFLYVQIVTSPTIHILTVLERHTQFLSINLIRFVLVAGAFIAAHILRLDGYWTIAAYAAAMVVHYTITSVKVMRTLGRT